MNLDITKHKIYLLSTLDPNDGRDDEAEKLIRPFAVKGFRFFNQLVFISEECTERINEHIRKYKTERYQFFLIDITENLDKGTFKGLFNQKYYPVASEALKILAQFKPVLPELTLEERKNALLDKISDQGIDSLTQKEKIFLDSLGKPKEKK